MTVFERATSVTIMVVVSTVGACSEDKARDRDQVRWRKASSPEALVTVVLDRIAHGDRAAIRSLIWTDAELAMACGGDATKLLRSDLERDTKTLVSLGDSQKRPTDRSGLAALVDIQLHAFEQCFDSHTPPPIRNRLPVLTSIPGCDVRAAFEVRVGDVKLDAIVEIDGSVGLIVLPRCHGAGAAQDLKDGVKDGGRAPAMERVRRGVQQGLEAIDP